MKFEDWLRDYFKEVNEMQKLIKEKTGKEANESKIYKIFLSNYIAYRSEKINRRLVWATWSLAIFSVILSGLTIYFQYIKK